MLETLSELPKEPLVYEAGGVIFASALLGFSHVMRNLLRTIGRRGLWLLPLAGAVLVLAAAILHGYAYFILMPQVAPDAPDIIQQVYRWRFIALMAMLVASLLTLAGALGLWLMFTGARRRQGEGKS